MKKIQKNRKPILPKAPPPEKKRRVKSRSSFREALAKSQPELAPKNKITRLSSDLEQTDSLKIFPREISNERPRKKEDALDREESVDVVPLPLGPVQNHAIPKEIETQISVDRQAVVDEIVQSILVSETSNDETKALLDINIAQSTVIIEITKHKNKSKIRFQTENKKIRHLLKTTQDLLRHQAKSAGIQVGQIQIQ